ncbi:hypothetical protein FEM48_Zijuj05G0146300 [Ziziphus jujuba var. spinosa]|uniref:Uncharacterized protein n=1 Tax=Ziziphus jujuba var. spinosa TaxID=714518 RepID=A0A978VFE2_ZIZJJ|nr:hypothetical protein FEM48_Zijuj05G0146300 [Ziziphus jujuba var. spinosa]
MSENARNAMIEKCLLGSSHQLWRNRVKELGQWVRKEFSMFVGIAGISSCVDITAFGLGWFAVGLKKRRSFSPFSICEAIGVVLLNSLIPDRSQIFYVAGFTVSKIVSKADKASNSSVCAKSFVRRLVVHGHGFHPVDPGIDTIKMLHQLGGDEVLFSEQDFEDPKGEDSDDVESQKRTALGASLELSSVLNSSIICLHESSLSQLISSSSNPFHLMRSFKLGTMVLIEKALEARFPNSGIKGNLHIESRLRYWKKQYGIVFDILNTNGSAWNDVLKCVEVDSDEVIADTLVKGHEDRSDISNELKDMGLSVEDQLDVFGIIVQKPHYLTMFMSSHDPVREMFVRRLLSQLMEGSSS